MKKYYDILDSGGGGDDKLPPPQPKGYIPLSVSDRAAWNGFLDYASKQNGVNLSDPKQQAGLLASYKKANPNFSITPDKIPAIQYEAYQLRKGDSFGNLNAKQLDYIRQGMQPNFLNADTNNIGKLYYPQKGSFGTDVEGYYNSKFNSGGTQTTDNPKATKVQVGQVNQPAPPPTALPAGATPRPDMNDSTARLKYLKTIAAQPGNDFVHGRGDYLLNVNKVPAYGTATFHDSAVKEANKLGLDPALLYSSSQEEGASGMVPDEKGNISTAEGTDPKYPVSGFANYGLDNFHDNFKEMVKRGYLPKDFDYKPDPNYNENKQKVMSGAFKTADDAMAAKAAYVKMEQDNLEDWSKKAGGGVQLSPTAKQFFTLISFNGGPGTAHKLINYYKSKGLLDGDKFLQVAPDKSVDPGGAYGHVLPRLQMANLLKKEAYFSK